jgi:ATP-dependent DNA helicase RecG
VLDSPVQFLKGIGPRKAEVLKAEASIETVEDLLYYAPRRYLDRSTMKPIVDCEPGEVVTVAGTIAGAALVGKGRRFLQVRISDGTASLHGVFFGGIHYLQKVFVPGEEVLFSGKVELFRGLQIVHPDFDFLDEDSRIQSINTGRIVPLYPSTEKLKNAGFDSRGFRRAIRLAIDSHIDSVSEPLEREIIDRLDLVALREALLSIHFPETMEIVEAARRRLAFNELFFMQYFLALSRRHLRETAGAAGRAIDGAPHRAFLSALPFALTGDQVRAADEIRADMERAVPMNRLLQGDVGSGKTVVAIAACLFAVGRGEQAAVMAPTEVLAAQHFSTFSDLLPAGVSVELLTGGTPRRKKTEVYASIADGSTAVVIGTHALIQDEVNFHRLGLIVIDEQHRFGGAQRARLRSKGESVDLLVMTATPIPRSLSLTLYGDMDVSYIREKPASRIPVKTMSFPESRLRGVYNAVRKYIAEGRQAYFVLPLVEESEKLDLKSAVETWETLKAEFPECGVGLLHGRMSADEKKDAMERFKSGASAIMVSTTVIEVGVDVPNASVMVIEHAERFGLSQLHQLRGRVGRGTAQSFCVLVHPDDLPAEQRRRIDAIVSTDDGFAIAEEDLRQRGAGEMLGVRQHGESGLEFASLADDIDLISAARIEAERIVASLSGAGEMLESIKKAGAENSVLEGLRRRRILSILS